jgi:hypothetical protein
MPGFVRVDLLGDALALSAGEGVANTVALGEALGDALEDGDALTPADALGDA